MSDEYMMHPVEETRATIFDSMIDLSIDISEIYLDMLLDDGMVKDIPALGTIYKVGKTVYSVGQLAFIKKTLAFAQEIQRNSIETGILEKHKHLLVSNPKKYYKELELIIEYLNRQVGCEKAVLNARVYYMYLSEQIDYEDFVLLLETIDRVYLTDLNTLIQIYKYEVLEHGASCSRIACSRLAGCALVEYYNGMIVKREGDDRNSIVRITMLGNVFCEAVLRETKENENE